LDDIAPIVIPENPPWLNPKPTFIFELTQHKKSETNPLLIQQHFAEIRSVTSEYSAIYTDGSKDGNKGFEFYNSQLPTGKKENRKQIMNLLFLEEATNIKARKFITNYTKCIP
jgi:hypothetical protein